MKEIDSKAFVDLLVRNMNEDDLSSMILYLENLRKEKISIKEKSYPTDWDDFVSNYVNENDVFFSINAIGHAYSFIAEGDKNERSEQFGDLCYPQYELACQSATLSKLLCLRKLFVKNWDEPADKDGVAKFYPKYDWNKNRWYSEGFYHRGNVLSFPTKEMCDIFIELYCELLDEVRIFL